MFSRGKTGEMMNNEGKEREPSIAGYIYGYYTRLLIPGPTYKTYTSTTRHTSAEPQQQQRKRRTPPQGQHPRTTRAHRHACRTVGRRTPSNSAGGGSTAGHPAPDNTRESGAGNGSASCGRASSEKSTTRTSPSRGAAKHAFMDASFA